MDVPYFLMPPPGGPPEQQENNRVSNRILVNHSHSSHTLCRYMSSRNSSATYLMYLERTLTLITGSSEGSSLLLLLLLERLGVFVLVLLGLFRSLAESIEQKDKHMQQICPPSKA